MEFRKAIRDIWTKKSWSQDTRPHWTDWSWNTWNACDSLWHSFYSTLYIWANRAPVKLLDHFFWINKSIIDQSDLKYQQPGVNSTDLDSTYRNWHTARWHCGVTSITSPVDSWSYIGTNTFAIEMRKELSNFLYPPCGLVGWTVASSWRCAFSELEHNSSSANQNAFLHLPYQTGSVSLMEMCVSCFLILNPKP